VLHVDQAVPGGWLAATAPGRLVVVRAVNPGAEFVERLWAALAGGIQPVLDVLTKDGLLATPAFALAEWTGDAERGFSARFIVRGSAQVEVDTEGGTRSLDAAGVSTWLEQPLTGVTGFRVDCDGAAPSGGVALPLGLGAAWVRSVRFGGARDAQDVALVDASVAAKPQPDPEPVGETTVIEPFGDDEPATDGESDQLFGATIVRSSDEPLRPPAADPLPRPSFATIAPPPFVTDPGASAVGDHDGFTVLSGDIDALRKSGQIGRGAPDPQAPAPVSAPAPVTPPAEPAFYLQLSDGSREPLTGTVIVGRAPSVSKVPGTRVPRLVTVDTPDHDISRNHVQFALEGDTVVVTDLHSRNGTLIVLPGKAPQKLRQGEPSSVIVGTLIDLGGGVTLTVGQS
jgi:FHA domain.